MIANWLISNSQLSSKVGRTHHFVSLSTLLSVTRCCSLMEHQMTICFSTHMFFCLWKSIFLPATGVKWTQNDQNNRNLSVFSHSYPTKHLIIILNKFLNNYKIIISIFCFYFLKTSILCSCQGVWFKACVGYFLKTHYTSYLIT